jgi:peptide/nickel transport system permease protein
VTVSLALSTIVLVIPIGLLLGILAGANEGGLVDRVVTAWCSVAHGVPTFFIGLLLAAFVRDRCRRGLRRQ